MILHRSLCFLFVSALITARTTGADPVATTAPTTQSVSVPATIEPFWSADLNAKVSGYVSDVKVDLGDHVTKGQLLAALSDPELEAGLAQAKATLASKHQMLQAADAAIEQARQSRSVAQKQLESYKADAQFQEITLKRAQELSAGNAATPAQLDEARSKAEVSKANLGIGEAKITSAEADIKASQANRDVAAAQIDLAEAQLQQAQVMLDYTKIMAPFDGVVTRRIVNPGDLVQTAGAAHPLFTVQQVQTVRIFCDVPETAVAGVTIGGHADVKVYGLGGKTISGTVTRLATSLNSETRTMRAEIDLPNPSESLRPGMYAQVTLTLQPPPVAEAAPQR
jgi:multidrug resistance efflux pump